MSSRRDFIKKTAIAGAGISVVPNMSFGSIYGKGDTKLRLAFIGVGLRGTNHLNNALQRKDLEITAICDVDPERIKIAVKKIEDAGFKKTEALR